MTYWGGEGRGEKCYFLSYHIILYHQTIILLDATTLDHLDHLDQPNIFTPLRLVDPQMCSISGVASMLFIRHSQPVIPLLDLRITHHSAPEAWRLACGLYYTLDLKTA